MLAPEAIGRASACPPAPSPPVSGPPTIPQGPTEIQMREDGHFYSACPPSSARSVQELTCSRPGWDTLAAWTDSPRSLPNCSAGARSKEAPSSDQEAPWVQAPGGQALLPSQQTLPKLLTRRPMAHLLYEKKPQELNSTQSGGASR